MKLYNTTGENADGAKANLWAGTQADASKQRVTLKKTEFKGVATDEVDVPTDKAGLLAFLIKNNVRL